jgi:Cell wall-active antibiotics response LiaF, C-terminal
MSRALAAAAAALALAAGSARAQTLRTLTSTRQLHGERSLTVDITYAAGQFRLQPAGPGDLYRMEMRYDDSGFAPVRDYDPATGVLRLGLRSLHEHSTWHTGHRDEPVPSLEIALTPSVPMSLDVEIGAAESVVELGGLDLTAVRYQTGASKSEVRFSRPNRGSCDSLAFRAGAAEFLARGLGNADCREMSFEGGLGAVTLDFTGAWRRSAEASVHVAVGTVQLRLPRDLGVSIALDRFLASFDQAGFTKRGGVYYSDNYDSAPRHLDLHVESALGGIQVVWVNGAP